MPALEPRYITLIGELKALQRYTLATTTCVRVRVNRNKIFDVTLDLPLDARVEGGSQRDVLEKP